MVRGRTAKGARASWSSLSTGSDFEIKTDLLVANPSGHALASLAVPVNLEKEVGADLSSVMSVSIVRQPIKAKQRFTYEKFPK